jgi:hypothetical protein
VTLGQLHDMLMTQVDWHYMMADDPRAYRAGESTVRIARGAADAVGPEGREMFDAFAAHFAVHDGEHPPLPTRPKE